MTKLGPHVLTRTDAAMRWVRRAPVVKAVNDPTPLMEAPPNAVRVFRYYFRDQRLDRDPVDAAQCIILALRGYRHPHLYVELYNEVAARLGEGLEQHVTLTEQVTRILHERGLRVAGFSFATGTPEPGDWWYLRARGYGGVDALALHEYWGDAGMSGWNALRYRKVHEWTGGQHPPVIITECGRDAVEGGQGGWQRDGIPAEQYVAELVAYDAEIAKDDYVLGATVFTAGATKDWRAFDTDPITDLLLARLPAAPSSGGTNVTQAEFDRYCADIWKRAGVPYNPQSAIATYWREQFRRGRYLGRPEEPEHPTENGQYVVQAFAGAVLHCRVGEWIVREGLPPFV